VVGIGDDTARVRGDIKPGDRVVALGAHLLHEGDKVRVDAAPRQLAAAAVAGGQR
jgi:hypothetical protein